MATDRSPFRRGAGLGAPAGALAGAVALLVLLAGRLISGSNGVLEVVHSGVTKYIPLPLFDAGIDAFGPYAKGLLFIGIAAAVPLAGALLGVLVSRSRPADGGSAMAESALAAGLAWLVAEAVVLPLFGAGLFGMQLETDAAALQVPLALAAVAFGVVHVGILRGVELKRTVEPAPRPEPRMAVSHEPLASAERAYISRRTLLGRTLVLLGLGSLAASSVAVLARVLAVASPALPGRAAAVPPGSFGPTPAVTPVEEFYVVGKDVLPTAVDAATWRLSISGLVDRPAEYSLDEIRALPAVEGYRTLQCISSRVVTYDRLIGNQRWRGVRVRELLDAAGVQPAARFVLWRSADGYTESIPLEVARDEQTWLVYEMGPPGSRLTPEHGFPVRVLIAGRYGMKQPKWLTEIILSDRDEPGYWEERGWDQTAAVRTYSRIDLPLESDQVPADRPFRVYGIASSGDRGIARVEVSADGGVTWQDAELEAEGGPITDLSWVRWRVEVRAPRAGRMVLLARATDDQGNVQDASPRPALPSGATGLHRVVVVAVNGLPG